MTWIRPVEPREPAMSKRDRRRVYVVIAVVIAAIFAAGVVAALVVGDEPICEDGKVPTAQAPVSLGRTQYLCQNGQIVTK